VDPHKPVGGQVFSDCLHAQHRHDGFTVDKMDFDVFVHAFDIFDFAQ
jgi:hypothetical protein